MKLGSPGRGLFWFLLWDLITLEVEDLRLRSKVKKLIGSKDVIPFIWRTDWSWVFNLKKNLEEKIYQKKTWEFLFLILIALRGKVKESWWKKIKRKVRRYKENIKS